METGTWSPESTRRFFDHRESVRGYVRYEVIRANIKDELGLAQSDSLRIGDVGGGEGYDSEWAAGLGHSVILIEPMAGAIDKLYERCPIPSNPPNFDVVQATADQAANMYRHAPFDILFSHGVLPYQKDPMEHLRHLSLMVKPGGHVSIVTTGKLGKVNRYKNDESRLLLLEATGKYINNNGDEAIAYLPQEFIPMLEAAGFKNIRWFGVRIHSDEDDRTVDEVPAFHLNRIMRREIQSSRDETEKAAGQMLQFIADV